MSDPKPLLVLWSKDAVETAGASIAALQAKLVEEATDIVSSAHDCFLHALPREGENACYVCCGNESPNRWRICVQVAVYKPLPPFGEDHPDPKWRGKSFRFPEVLDSVDNQIFAAYDDIVAP